MEEAARIDEGNFNGASRKDCSLGGAVSRNKSARAEVEGREVARARCGQSGEEQLEPRGGWTCPTTTEPQLNSGWCRVASPLFPTLLTCLAGSAGAGGPGWRGASGTGTARCKSTSDRRDDGISDHGGVQSLYVQGWILQEDVLQFCRSHLSHERVSTPWYIT